MNDLLEDVIYVGLAHFLLMFEMGLSIGVLTLGVFTTYFGLGKTRKIGIVLGALGLCGLLVILVVSEPEGVPSDWKRVGIVSTIGFATGMAVCVFAILMTVLKGSANKEDEFAEIKDSDLENELKKLEQEMGEGEELV